MSVALWLLDRLSRMLDPEEREVVQGDLLELHVPARRALYDVLSLLVRRQFAQWRSWRPWTALALLVVPLGFALAVNSVWLGRSYNLYLWTLGNYRDINLALLYGNNTQLARGIAMLLGHSLLLGCWSWTAGFVLAAISRRAIAVTGALFWVMLWLGEVASAPRRIYYVAGSAFPNAANMADQLTVLLVLLVCLPALLGMWKGRRSPALGLQSALMLAAAIASLTVIARLPGWWINWPALYILIASILQRRRPLARRSA